MREKYEVDYLKEKIINVSMIMGQALLHGGAETSRVEDSIRRFCQRNGYRDLHVFVTPTIIIMGELKNSDYTRICRVFSRSINLNTISEINDFSYKICGQDWEYEKDLQWLETKAQGLPLYRSWTITLASAISSACFTKMLGGNNLDFAAAFFVGGLVMLLLKSISGYRPSAFWENALAGVAIGGLTIGCCSVSPQCNMDLVIGGSLMPFLPGTAFVNSVRDYMGGDLVSGNSRFAEALLFAVAIALGLAFSLKIWLLWGMQ